MELGEGAGRIFGTRQGGRAGRSSKVFFFLFVCFGREREEALESEGASTNPEPNPLLSSTDFSS